MTPGLTSIVVPTYNHGAYVLDAVASALAQTAPVEVLVIDDGSDDDTQEKLATVADKRLRVFKLPHQGVCVARNFGILAAEGEFIAFLDADDVIAPEKVAKQLVEMTPEIGWVICDGLIDDEATGKRHKASDKYDYVSMRLNGWIASYLVRRNFIPSFSPLVRRRVMDNIRFVDHWGPEDHHVWHAVATVARVAYVPEVLGTYRHRRTGRSRLPREKGKGWPTVKDPLRLNLGCGTQGTPSWNPLAGFVNLDKSMGWMLEDGLGHFIDGQVSGITLSHCLMYVKEQDWPKVFAEFARVLGLGGVVRITEDWTDNPDGARYGGWQGSDPFVTLTTPDLVRRHLEQAGLVAQQCRAGETLYRDRSLCQDWHHGEPHSFFMEGRRQECLFLSPHFDDETLFGAYSILRHRPRVVVCFPSERDYGDNAIREVETREALNILGGVFHAAWDGTDLQAKMAEYDAKHRPEIVFAPSVQTSHPQHVAVAKAAAAVFGDRLVRYHTYQGEQRVTDGTEVVPADPAWVNRKARALERYRTQLAHPRAKVFFGHDQREFLA